MGKKAKAPPPVNYQASAQDQAAANITAAKQQAVLNNPNIVNPYGSQTVTYDQNGQPTVTQSLSPAEQQKLDAQNKVDLAMSNLGVQGAANAQNILSTPFQYKGPDIQTSLGDVGQATGANLTGMGSAGINVNAGKMQNSLDLSNLAKMPVNAGMTGQQAIMDRLAPQLQRESQAQAQTLANQGITPGSEAWKNAQTDTNQRQNDLLSQAALQGINLDLGANQQGYSQALGAGNFVNQAQAQDYNQQLGTSQAQNAALAQNQSAAAQQAALNNAAIQQNYNQQLGAAQFGNTGAQQSLQQQLALRNQPINEIAGLMGGAQVNMPQFQGYTGGGNIGAAPVYDATKSSAADQMAIYNAQQSANNALTGAVGSMGGGLLSAVKFSDRRLKSNIVRVGTHPIGVGIYDYDINGHRERGVMAQELEQVMPEAVLTAHNGFKMVNYGML